MIIDQPLKIKSVTFNRWNSYFDSVKCLVEVLNVPEKMDAINTLGNNHANGPAPFGDIDKQVTICNQSIESQS